MLFDDAVLPKLDPWIDSIVPRAAVGADKCVVFTLLATWEVVGTACFEKLRELSVQIVICSTIAQNSKLQMN